MINKKRNSNKMVKTRSMSEYQPKSKRIKLEHPEVKKISETEKHHHTGGWTPTNHYGMCGQSCPCCRAEIEETPFGVCPICWKNLDKGPLPNNY